MRLNYKHVNATALYRACSSPVASGLRNFRIIIGFCILYRDLLNGGNAYFQYCDSLCGPVTPHPSHPASPIDSPTCNIPPATMSDTANIVIRAVKAHRVGGIYYSVLEVRNRVPADLGKQLIDDVPSGSEAYKGNP